MTMDYYNSGNNSSVNGRVIDMPNQMSYTSINLDPEFDLDLSGSGNQKPVLRSTIHTFQKRRNKVYGHFQHAVKPMLSIQTARRCFLLVFLNIFVFMTLLSWSSYSNSLSLRAFMYLSVFDFMTLFTYLVSLWFVSRQKHHNPNGIHLFNQERTEILLVFSSVVLSGLGAVFILKESFLRILDQPDIAIGRLIPGALLGFVFHVLVAFSIKNKPLQCVSEASSSSIIQEHMSDLSQPLCSVIPMLKRILQPRVDPFFLLSTVGACLLLLTDLLIQIDLYYSADTAASFLLALCTINTMWPITVCSAKVLLNTTPPYVLGQLDKLLSETQTLDGVLEIRNEKFHTISLTSKHHNTRASNGFGLVLIGSLTVRVRRGANEQMVLAHVTNRLSPLVSQLTVQIVRDEWTTNAVAPPSGLASTLKSPIGSSLVYGFNKPAAAVAPYLQTPPRVSLPQSTQTQTEVKLTSDTTSSNAVPRKLSDDFSFSLSTASSVNKPKPASYSNAGVNIARMYKAAGYTTLPSASKRVSGSSNLLSK